MNSYKFQYYNWTSEIEDTWLISMAEAYRLFEKYKSHFKEAIEKGKEPNLAIWNNCTETSYWWTDIEWHYKDIIIINWQLYIRMYL